MSTESKATATITAADLNAAAVRLLARREHSRHELITKLCQRGGSPEVVASVVEALAERGLQSDQRHAEHYARGRAERGYGPLRIRAELQQRGIDRALISQVFDRLEVDWLAAAAQWYERRYAHPPSDVQDKARRQQALQRRGHPHEVIRELVN